MKFFKSASLFAIGQFASVKKYPAGGGGTLLVAFLIVGLFMSSCEYELHDPSFTEIIPPDPSPIQMSLNNNFDTLKICWTTTLSYDVTSQNKIISVSIQFQGKNIHNNTGEHLQTFSFTLDPSTYQNGTYPLHIEIVTSSGTGSLADKLGAEVYMYQLDWPVVIDKTPPKKLNIISIDSLKKGVRVSWEKFSHLGFRYYKLKKSSEAFRNCVDLVKYLDPDQTSFIDTTYMEGMDVTYIIELGGISSGVLTSTTNSKEYIQMTHKPRVNMREFKADLYWDPPNNIHLLDYYTIYQSKTIQSYTKVSEPFTRPKSYSVSFGAKNYFGIYYVPKVLNYGAIYTNSLKAAEIEFEIGQQMPAYRYACPIHGTENILLSNKGRLYKYNLRTGIVLDSIVSYSEYPDYFALSPDGSFFGYSQNGKFITRSTNDFRILNSMSNPDFSNNIRNLLRFSVSNNGRLMVILNSKKVYIFDLASGAKIAEKQFININWLIGSITPDGTSILTQEYGNINPLNYYRITGTEIVNIANIPVQNMIYFPVIPHIFGPDDDIYLLGYDSIEVRNTSDFSVKTVIPLKGIQYIDFDNMQAVGVSSYTGSDLGYWYDLKTGAVTKELLVHNMNQMIFHSGYLVNTVGRKMLLQPNN